MKKFLVAAMLFAAPAFIASPAVAGPAAKKGHKASPAEIEARKKAEADKAAAEDAKRKEDAKPKDRHVKVSVNDNGFDPSSFDGKVGELLFLDITRRTDKACNGISTFNGNKEGLPKNTEKSIKVDTSVARTMLFECPALPGEKAAKAEVTIK